MGKEQFTFEVHDHFLDSSGKEGIVYLLRSNWDDFGYKTSFHVMMFLGKEYETIGTIKIGATDIVNPQ